MMMQFTVCLEVTQNSQNGRNSCAPYRRGRDTPDALRARLMHLAELMKLVGFNADSSNFLKHLTIGRI